MISLAQWVLAVLITALAAVGDLVPNDWRWLTGYIAIIALLALAQALLAQRGVKSAKQLKLERTVEVNHILAPLAGSLARITAATGKPVRRQAVSAFLADATAACVGLTPAERCRATFYSIEGEQSSRIFVPWATTGRSDPPFSRFREDDDGEGAEVWRVATSGQYAFVKDTRSERIPHFDRQRERRYRTFITVPVLLDEKVVGLLTLNAPEPDDLTRDDVETMRLVANLAAAAIGMAGGKCPTRG